MSKEVVLFLAEGFEEVEASTPIDFLRRSGVVVNVVSIMDTLEVKGANDLVYKADYLIKDIDKERLYDGVVIPGGMPGAKNLAENETVIYMIRNHFKNNKLVAAICASPGLVFAQSAKIVKGKTLTCYPSFERYIEKQGGKVDTSVKVCVDGNMITSRGPGTAGYFALECIRYLVSEDMMQQIGKGTLILPAEKDFF